MIHKKAFHTIDISLENQKFTGSNNPELEWYTSYVSLCSKFAPRKQKMTDLL